MRVCFLNPHGYLDRHPPLGKTDTGGQTVYVLELARALGRQDVQVDLVTRQFDGKPHVEDVAANVRIVRIKCGSDSFVVKEQLYDLINEFVQRFEKYTAEQSISYDLLHTHYWDGGYAGLLLQRRWSIPHVFTPHSLGKWKEIALAGNEATDLSALYRYKLRIATEKRILRAADVVLTLSQIQRVRLMQHYTVDFDKLRVLYPGVDTAVFHPAVSNDLAPSRLPTRNNMLLVSRFVPAKGVDSAIEVLRRVVARMDCHLYVVTTNKVNDFSIEEFENERLVRGLIEEYGLVDRVTFLGHIEDRDLLAGYYRDADIFLLPSRYEPFGLTAVEALACGAVTIVSRAAGSRELVLDGVNGFVVDMREPDEVADLIIELFTDKGLANRVAENGVLTIQRHFSWDVTARKLLRYVYPPASGTNVDRAAPDPGEV